MYRVHESDETLGYERPETPSIARPVVEPVAMPPRALRAQKTVRPTIPEFVKAAKIELQGDKCTWCQRRFESPVLHRGEVVILEPEADHFKPVADRGKTTDDNINYHATCAIG